jgi:hypothetical protein
MEEQPHRNSQPSCIEWLAALWQTLDKRQVATIGGVVVTAGTLAVLGLRKGVPWYLAHRQ